MTDVVQKALIGIVDDDVYVLEAIGFLLVAFGYDVVQFPSAESMLADEVRARIECLVTDLRLPGLSGLQLHERLRTEGIAAPTIIVTAFADEHVRQQARQPGVVALLQKPVANDVLLLAISSALDGDLG